jgi:DNA-binding beta-propeller fold protein YncE
MGTDTLVWTIAGVDSAGYEGDGGPAVEAALNTPRGVAAAPGGFPIYVADTANHCIRAIDAQGVITTIAGDGQPGSSGDGGPAFQARLHTPSRIRLDDATGDLYVTDVDNHRIRRINTSGIITTVAGGDGPGYSGDGGLAVGALLNAPLDARIGPDGALYIADTNNHRIRRVDSSGIISTVVGSGFEGTRLDAQESGPPLSTNLRSPCAIAFDSAGTLFIADTYNSVVRRVHLEP